MSSPDKTLILYSNSTPNGHRVSAYLEELKAAYGLDYDIHKIELSKGVQKEPWFIKLNPNGKIPVLVDQRRDNFAVFESSAILLYLAQHYDKEFKFIPDPTTNPNEYSELLQWMFFTHGGVGPIKSQAYHFHRVAPEDIPYAKTHFTNEVKRLYGVLEIRMTGREWIVGPGKGTYSIADINTLPWLKLHDFAGVESLDEWPNIKAWLARYLERAAVQDGTR